MKTNIWWFFKIDWESLRKNVAYSIKVHKFSELIFSGTVVAKQIRYKNIFLEFLENVIQFFVWKPIKLLYIATKVDEMLKGVTVHGEPKELKKRDTLHETKLFREAWSIIIIKESLNNYVIHVLIVVDIIFVIMINNACEVDRHRHRQDDVILWHMFYLQFHN